MSETFDADVIIAGAGMAGATLALALKQGGLTPLLIDPIVFDAQLAPTFDGRSSAIAFASFRQWRALGLAAGHRAPRPADRADPGDRRPQARGPRRETLHRSTCVSTRAEIADRSDGEPLGYLLENRRSRAALAKAGDQGRASPCSPRPASPRWRSRRPAPG
jgi:2-octaprenyl-6-methoxyphenol hydroxylase